MSKNDLMEFSKIIRALAANFGASVSKELYSLWFDAFTADGITMTQIRDAAGRILRTRKYSSMPTYAEFLDHIIGTTKDAANIQADIVLEALTLHGGSKTPEFEDKITRYLMKTRWPWRDWASKVETKTLVWWRRDFIEAYEAMSRTMHIIPDRLIDVEPRVKQLIGGLGK